jgi:hypothetical protein
VGGQSIYLQGTIIIHVDIIKLEIIQMKMLGRWNSEALKQITEWVTLPQGRANHKRN